MSNGTPPCLSVRQPWASAVVLGFKNIENRSWTTTHRGLLLIHASVRTDPGWRDTPQAPLIRQIHPPSLWRHVHGLIIGTVQLVDIVTSSDSPWAAPAAKYHWLLGDAAVLDDPVAARGHLGLWRPEGRWL